jgi:hypothetical protein
MYEMLKAMGVQTSDSVIEKLDEGRVVTELNQGFQPDYATLHRGQVNLPAHTVLGMNKGRAYNNKGPKR